MLAGHAPKSATSAAVSNEASLTVAQGSTRARGFRCLLDKTLCVVVDLLCVAKDGTE